METVSANLILVSIGTTVNSSDFIHTNGNRPRENSHTARLYALCTQVGYIHMEMDL